MTEPASSQPASGGSTGENPSFTKLAMRNMVRKGRQSLVHFGLTALGLVGFLTLVAWLGNQPKANASRLGVTGMCRGGRMAWMYTAHNPRVKATVAWYGHFSPVPPAMTQTPIDVADKISVPARSLTT